MTPDDRRLAAALRAQLAQRRRVLAAGATHVGWKLGMGERERLGGPVVGYLTSATLLRSGAAYRGPGGELHADAELGVVLGRAVQRESDAATAASAVARWCCALELCDLSGTDDAGSIVAANVFHRAVAFGDAVELVPAAATASLVVNGQPRATAAWPADIGERLAAAARALGLVGERLRAGDRIITGSIVQVPVSRGDSIVAELATLGRVELRVESAQTGDR